MDANINSLQMFTYPSTEILTCYGFGFHIRRHLGFLPLLKQVQLVYFLNIHS